MTVLSAEAQGVAAEWRERLVARDRGEEPPSPETTEVVA